MSIGADWRQNSPGSVAGLTKDVANNKFANSGPGEQLVDGAQEGRDFSEYMFGEDGFEFSDVLDVINPLQHIPGVGMLYRSLTGDELGNGARVVGGGLFGGVFGLAGAAIDAVVDAVSGEDTGAHVMAFLEDSFNGAPTDDGTAVVDAAPSGADAPDAVTARADTIANASFDGTYQGDLVLPWMAGQPSQGRLWPKTHHKNQLKLLPQHRPQRKVRLRFRRWRKRCRVIRPNWPLPWHRLAAIALYRA